MNQVRKMALKVLTLIILGSLLNGCGITGDLYEPAPETPAQDGT